MSKLILCSPQLGISPDTNSGGEVYDREVLKHLAESGVRVEIILPKNRKYEKGIKNWHITYLPVKTIFPPYLFNVFLLPYLFRIFAKEKFDILRVHSPYFIGLAAVFFKFFKKNIPLIASYLHLENRNIIFTIIDKLVIGKFDHIITISNATKKEIGDRYSYPANKISVSYPGVDSRFRPKTKNKKLQERYDLVDKNVLLYFGGLKFRKNITFLLDIIKVLNSDTILLICGEGNAKFFLKVKAFLLGVSKKVRFAGYVQENEKVDFYNLADVFLLPSKKEGFGMISVEAQACRVPVIVSDSSSLPETLLDGETGFVCKFGDKKDWMDKINRLLSDKKLKTRMGKKAQEFAKKTFSWEKSALIQKRIFEKLVAQK